ncbi:unnamed protein product [Spirodela intermedia]|uniref:Phosphatidylinositol N-acetylglucosaminyltransferase subunit H conserved domain-containing protein n=1 Tax=Spirodela intermedia TaxID=51605 RepID=A0A7I8IVH0_SPIIN|nr:unnamed protein product [Spirodela intermedia]CAA6661858.1 unnamed protein product [Spirodela intermedia]
MSKIACSDSRYTYYREIRNGSLQTIDVHEIIVARSNGRIIFLCASILLLLLHVSNLAYLMNQESQVIYIVGALLLSILVIISSQLRVVQKERVVIMPAFGVQLETYYWSGRVSRRLLSVGKILRPVLNEIVTPVRCYWSLALVLDGHEELMPVFQESQPPVKMLAPIWKALCAATGGEE